jgi:uncharacterized protein DUF4190
MTQTQSGPGEHQPNPSRAAGPDAEPLGHLYKMSPTAGVATTDYASINSIAIAAIILGIASLLCLLNPYLLFLPAVGLICGFVAVRQIRNSNGTQVGGGLALAGLLASLLIGGGVGGMQLIRAIRNHVQERQVDALIQSIGQDIRDERYDAVYDLASPRLQSHVSREEFIAGLATLNAVPQLGKVESLQWNGLPMVFEVNSDTGAEHCVAMTLERMQRLAEPGRELMGFEKVSGKWTLDELPRLFASKPAKRTL